MATDTKLHRKFNKLEKFPKLNVASETLTIDKEKNGRKGFFYDKIRDLGNFFEKKRA